MASLIATALCSSRCALTLMRLACPCANPREPARPDHSPQVTVEQLEAPQALYKALGCKTVVGLPFKDIATIDAYLLREVPSESAAEARQTIKRMQDVAIHPIVPAAVLQATPLPGAIPLMTLAEAAAAPHQSRLVISLNGKESAEEIAKLNDIEHDFVLLEVRAATSRSTEPAPTRAARQFSHATLCTSAGRPLPLSPPRLPPPFRHPRGQEH